ncbi:MAG: Arc family DNA-binding protein [Synergistaceae bacterium]|nr:Arc family DNA-binding protein [Synergistaceae bacterium]
MSVLTVRNIPDEVHSALRVRAATNGRSMEAEVRDILKNALKPGQRLQMGNAIAELGSRLGLTKDDFAAFELARNDTPAEPMNFE